jgi:hypothetical protein
MCILTLRCSQREKQGFSSHNHLASSAGGSGGHFGSGFQGENNNGGDGQFDQEELLDSDEDDDDFEQEDLPSSDDESISMDVEVEAVPDQDDDTRGQDDIAAAEPRGNTANGGGSESMLNVHNNNVPDVAGTSSSSSGVTHKRPALQTESRFRRGQNPQSSRSSSQNSPGRSPMPSLSPMSSTNFHPGPRTSARGPLSEAAAAAASNSSVGGKRKRPSDFGFNSELTNSLDSDDSRPTAVFPFPVRNGNEKGDDSLMDAAGDSNLFDMSSKILAPGNDSLWGLQFQEGASAMPSFSQIMGDFGGSKVGEGFVASSGSNSSAQQLRTTFAPRNGSQGNNGGKSGKPVHHTATRHMPPPAAQNPPFSVFSSRIASSANMLVDSPVSHVHEHGSQILESNSSALNNRPPSTNGRPFGVDSTTEKAVSDNLDLIAGQIVRWGREEDKAILIAVRRNGPSQNTWVGLMGDSRLDNKSAQQICARYEKLMQLMKARK